MTTILPGSLRLIGRAAELEILIGLVDRMSECGGALFVRGEPGIGKTSLLGAATRRATDRKVQVLSAVGVPSEADVAFSGLHQLLLSATDRLRGQPIAPADAPQVSITMLDRLEQLPRSPWLFGHALVSDTTLS
jgi:predicted ATPase